MRLMAGIYRVYNSIILRGKKDNRNIGYKQEKRQEPLFLF
jgi:hypothetical protein